MRKPLLLLLLAALGALVVSRARAGRDDEDLWVEATKAIDLR